MEHDNENVRGCTSKKSRSRSFKSRVIIPNSPQMMEMDENKEVLTIDVEGKHMLLSGLIRSRDIDLLETGVRCVVKFNDFHQPLHRGGFVLVKYLGSLAKNRIFCPIEEKTWYLINGQLKALFSWFGLDSSFQMIGLSIIQSSPEFVNNGGSTNPILRKGNSYHWKGKKEQIYNDVPHGQERISCIRLVDHWYSEENEVFTQWYSDHISLCFYICAVS